MEPFQDLGEELPDGGNRMCQSPGVGREVVYFRDKEGQCHWATCREDGGR